MYCYIINKMNIKIREKQIMLYYVNADVQTIRHITKQARANQMQI